MVMSVSTASPFETHRRGEEFPPRSWSLAFVRSIPLVAWRWPLLGAERRREGGRVGLEARAPGVRGRVESGQPVEAHLPARSVSSGATSRQLVDEHQAGAAAIGKELESKNLLPPSERERIRLV